MCCLAVEYGRVSWSAVLNAGVDGALMGASGRWLVMRITIVLPCFDLSGGIRAAAAHAEQLYRRGHRVVAVAPRGESAAFKTKLKFLLIGRGWPVPWQQGPSHFDGLAVPHQLLSRPGPVTAAELPEADIIIS